MSGGWADSDRVDRLPPGWYFIRRRILLRDPLCRLRYADICTSVSTQVDHVEAGDNHEDDNLQGVCAPCHGRKSSAEGNAARPRTTRPAEPHPGWRR